MAITLKLPHATVYQTRKNGAAYHEIRWKEAGEIQRKTMKDLGEAEAFARQVSERMTLALPGRIDWDEFRLFCEFRKAFPDVPMAEVLAFYEEAHQPTITLEEAVDKYLQAQRGRGLSPRTITSYTDILAWAAEALGHIPLNEVSVEDLDDYLNGIEDLVTRTNHRQVIVCLFRWARNRGHVPPEIQTAAERTNRPRIRTKDPVPLAVGQLRRLFVAIERVDPTLQLPLALGALAGLRTCEIDRLRWEHVNLETREIWLPTPVTKTRRRRPVRICPALHTILSRFLQVSQPRVYKDWQQRVSRLCGDWVPNGLRKGFVSHALMYYENIAQVALWTGHSETVLKTYYMGLVSSADAKEWFEFIQS